MSFSRYDRSDKSQPSKRERALEKRVFERDRSVWFRKDGDDPGSPLTVERVPIRSRSMSKLLIAKRKRHIVSKAGGKGRSALATDLPFFIDKTPSVDLRTPKRRRGNLNDSVVLLDGPEPSSTLQAPKTNPVDVVDLCSESEEEQPIPQKRDEEKRKRAELPKVVEEPKNDSLDVIVIDENEDNRSEDRSKSSTDKQYLDTNGTTSRNQPKTMEKTNRNKCIRTDGGSDRSKSRSDRSCVRNTSNTNRSTKGTSSSDFNAFSLFSGASSYSNPAIAASSSSKSTISSTNDSSSSNSRNAKDTMDMTTLDFSQLGSNIFNPNGNVVRRGLRPIIIDGCNVAISHGGDRRFSVRGLCICVEFFLRRGHSVVAVVPMHLRSDLTFDDRRILDSLRNDRHLVFTPSRFIDNRLIASYDDRYIVQYAAAVGGVIVSRDNYRDLLRENPAWRDAITNRLLMPTWLGDMLMFPLDPLGRYGPTLEQFLQFPEE